MVKIVREAAKKSFQKFCDGTSMHGFIELYYAKNSFWLVFWIITVAIALSFSFRQIYAASIIYSAQLTTSNIQLAAKGDLIYPSLKICYPHWSQWVKWEKGFNMNFTREGILHGLSYLDKVYTAQPFNEMEAEKNFIEGMNSNNIKRITDFYYLTSVDVKSLIRDFNVTQKFQIDYNTEALRLCYVLDGKKIPEGIKMQKERQKEENPRNLKANMQRSSSKSNTLHGLVYIRTKDDISENMSDLEYVKYMRKYLNKGEGDGLEKETLDTMATYSTLIYPIAVYPNMYDESNFFYILAEDTEVSISIKLTIQKWKNTKQMPCEVNWKWITPNDTCENKKCKRDIYWNELQNWKLKLELFEAFMFDNDTLNAKVVRRPVQLIDKDTIINKTTKEFIDEYDNEIDEIPKNKTEESFADILKKSRSAYTARNDSDHAEINKENVSSQEDSFSAFLKCLNNCQTGCQVYSYDINVRKDSLSQLYSQIKERRSFKVELKFEYPTESEVQVMTEQDMENWEGFVGNVGGILGVWTGASVLSFIQMCYHCCCMECQPSIETKNENEKATKKKKNRVKPLKVGLVRKLSSK